jgi:hypothetical protein
VQSQLLWLAYFTNYTASTNEFTRHIYISKVLLSKMIVTMAMAVLALAAWEVLQQIGYCLGIVKLPKEPRKVQSQMMQLAFFGQLHYQFK